MVRELVQNPKKRDTYLGTAFWLNFFDSFTVVGLIGVIVPMTMNDATSNLFIFIIATGMIFQTFGVVDFYFKSQVRRKIVSAWLVRTRNKRGRVKRSKARNLLERLVNCESDVLWFMTEEQVPFTYEQGENDVLITNAQQKISGCFLSMDGAQTFC
jgi:hypothetical protein